MSTLRVNSVSNLSGNDLTVPPGAVQFFARNTAPNGWIKANGAALSRSTYADLFTAIGTAFGVGDGSTTFTLPDMRGEFPRGWDDGRGIDSGRAFGGFQQGTSHYFTNTGFRVQGDQLTENAERAFTTTAYNTITVSGTLNFNDSRTFSFSRPRNIALLACIKY